MRLEKNRKLKKGMEIKLANTNIRGPSSVDKAAYIMSNLSTPAPSFTGWAKVLAGQAFKGVKDNVDYYRGGGIIDSLLTSGVKGSPWQVDIKS